MLLLMLPFKEYLGRLAEPRSIADVVLVFLLVYGVLKLLRGTRADPASTPPKGAASGGEKLGIDSGDL